MKYSGLPLQPTDVTPGSVILSLYFHICLTFSIIQRFFFFFTNLCCREMGQMAGATALNRWMGRDPVHGLEHEVWVATRPFYPRKARRIYGFKVDGW